MRIRFLLFHLMLCANVGMGAVSSSPAGGGYLQVYTAGDYVYVGDSDAFDANIGANPGLTIEMWIYQKRSMVDLEPRAVNRIKPHEQWYLMSKKGSYFLIAFGYGDVTDGVSFCPDNGAAGAKVDASGELPLNQWNYVAIMVNSQYKQGIINTQLTGSTLRERGRFLGLLDTPSSLRIGGGVKPNLGLPGVPLAGKPTWTPFTEGLIDEIRISNIVRYPKKELAEGFWKETVALPPVPFEPDEHTVALWHFDVDGSLGSKWRDASGNGHHLTYHGNYLGVESAGKLATTWGELKSRR